MRCDTKFGDRQHVVGADARGQQRLVRVAERGVGEQQALLLQRPLGELFGPELQQQLARARRAARVGSCARHAARRERARARLALRRRIAVDDHVAR